MQGISPRLPGPTSIGVGRSLLARDGCTGQRYRAEMRIRRSSASMQAFSASPGNFSSVVETCVQSTARGKRHGGSIKRQPVQKATDRASIRRMHINGKYIWFAFSNIVAHSVLFPQNTLEKLMQRIDQTLGRRSNSTCLL